MEKTQIKIHFVKEMLCEMGTGGTVPCHQKKKKKERKKEKKPTIMTS
jgi:hypothetical protein